MFGANLSVFQKGLLLAGVPFLFQFLFIGFLLRAQADASEAERWAVHTKEVIAQAELTFRLTVQSLSRARGAVVSGDPNFFPAAAAFDAAIPPEIDKLRRLVGENRVGAEQVDQYRATVVRLLDWVGEERRWVGEGRREQAVDRVKSHEGERLMAAVQARLDALLAEEQELDRRRTAEVGRARRMGNWVLGASAAVGLAMVGGMLWAFTSGIASRLETVAANVERLAAQQPLLPPVGGSDEIARADAALHAAARQLADADAAGRRFRAELEQRAAELGRVNHDLSLKTQENETFVYSVSHDLRSPLVNLQGFSNELTHACEDLRRAASADGVPQDVRDRLAAMIDGDIAESVRFIQTAVTRSAGIIDALLRLSRAGRVEYKMQAVDVGAVVARVVAAMGATVRQRGAEVRVAPDLPAAWADASAADQVFGNLIGNALNYLDPSRPGRVEIGWVSGGGDASGNDGVRNFPSDDPAGAEASPASGTGVTYFVRDNGLGIPEAYLPKMFVAFQRLHGNVAPGEGIGLALVRRVVERHGGKIWVESAEGAGSTFYVFLPTPPPGPATTEVPAGPVEPAEPAQIAGRENTSTAPVSPA